MFYCKDLKIWVRYSPGRGGNSEDRKEDHSEGFASIFATPSPACPEELRGRGPGF
jgi:hypothetical protein